MCMQCGTFCSDCSDGKGCQCSEGHTPFDPATLSLSDGLKPPVLFSPDGEWTFALGTDDQGRDVLSSIMYGTRLSLVVGFAATVAAMLIGIALGLIAGYIGGTVDNQLTGVAILSHPDNFRSPQPMRLHPSEPFFCFAPSQLGDWKIEPGQPYVSKYRFIVSDGPANKEVIDRMWNDYAYPPMVTVK